MTDLYDYVVVGGGSAGCVVASRLSENPHVRVCLIEAGGNNRTRFMKEPLTSVLLNVPKKGKANWGFETVEQPGLNGRVNYQPRGKGLGGSSAINGMLYVRGHAKDFNDWAALGNEGWSYRDVLPYFKKSEDNVRGADEYHGTGGPLKVSERGYEHHSHSLFIEACSDLGLGKTDDFNGAKQEGAGWYQLTQKERMRCSTSYAFIEPNRNRPNLDILVKSLATKIVFDGKTAVAVEIIRKGKKEIVKAKKEIIISAGAYQSPQLLMLSGVGEAGELGRHSIPVVVNIPGVGKNLQEHVDFGLVYKTDDTSFWGESNRKLMPAIRTALEYLFHRKGKIASVLYESGGFFKTTPEKDRPDIQMHYMPAAGVDHGRVMLPGHGLSLHVCVLRPESKGTVGLKDSNPLSEPLIDLNLFDNNEDMETLLRGVKLGQKILRHQYFSTFTLRDYFFKDDMSDEEMVEVIRNHANTVYHPVGTCKMGSDKDSVVDPELRVHGIKNLRVADASIMPTIVGGNTNAAAIMIGEKCADMILSAGAQ
ncbi:glucose-methanol-choline oxidoreductase [Spongiibacter sp. KMU-166]|uniref:Glucose-methanol-choline oxidoreductase n=1 Tax=Spongiibacter thalassae TaxID=2721624 RepID=A0ABX1GA93_9GAMM|nr:GMC family oxidoreductase N-terminal domain-containing protein [Spongiibacter thalassae]NKI15870.1 glucose-methanol-choline oxidoreductase [Spongiibacter thalassae]